jgi:alpha-1,6-mannosyltransferase
LAASADPDEYAEAVRALFERDIEAIGAAARVYAVEKFAWNRVFEDLCMVYGEVSGRPEFVGQSGEQPVH